MFQKSRKNKRRSRVNSLTRPAFFILFLTLFSLPSVFGQELPDRIRGYKVYKKAVSIKQAEPGNKNSQVRLDIKFDEPEIEKISPLGVTFSLGGEITIFDQSGKVDFIAFKDFKVNDLSVEIEEYKDSFEFSKNKSHKLEKPIEIFIGTAQTLRGAAREVKNSEDKWKVTGTVFVFGHFKKFGFNFKRVIPVKVEMMISNPIKKALTETEAPQSN